jgi:hypothetical protein
MFDYNRLLSSPNAYIRYNAEFIINKYHDSYLYDEMEKDEKIKDIIQELKNWPGPEISSHKSANQSFHKLVFLADIGLDKSSNSIDQIGNMILNSFDHNNVPCLHMTINEKYGGTGRPEKAWALCDAPNILYALKKMGFNNTKVNSGIEYLVNLIEPFGFTCNVSQALGKWHGPGKKSEPCPYATLIMLKLMNLDPEIYGNEIMICANSLLELWEFSLQKHPYIFYMGNDFRKLKVPFIWYDIVHVTSVISQVSVLKNDKRLQEMFSIIKEKEASQGYIPESIYMPWKEWDFGQKKRVSEWLSLCILETEFRLMTDSG